MDNNIVKLAVDRYFGRGAAENYSSEDTMETLRQALIEANNGSTKLDYRAIRDGKCNGLFAIVEEIINKTVIEGLPESCPLFDYVEWRNLKEGDTNVFELRDDGSFIVSDIAQATQGLRRQRLTGGSEITVKTQLKGVKVYEELRRILAGRIDFNDLIEKVSEAFQKKMRDDMYEAVVATFDGLTAPYSNGAAGSFDEAKLTQIIDHVEAATGMKATIIGSKQAVRKITGVKGADANSAKEELFSMGYYGHFYTTPVIVMDNAHKVGTTDFVLGNDLYIIASDEKFIKAVTEGETLIINGEPTAKADLSQEYLMTQAWGMKAVVAEDGLGIYKLS
ncbi:MAG: hypothetical protein KBT35_05840 [Firmicutes bacterium]|nr:hypothetical protein [Candidatus Colivicinus equi]